MLTFAILLLSTLQLMIVVKCEYQFLDPELRKNPIQSDLHKAINMLGIMTPYPEPMETTSNTTESGKCEASKAFLVTGNGSIHPKEPFKYQLTELVLLKNRLEKLYSNKNDAYEALPADSKIVIDDIMLWENKMTGEHNTVNEQGKLTMNNLGRRWNSKLRNIVGNTNTVEFYSANKYRCSVSGKEFLNGFFKTTDNQTIILPELKLLDLYDYRINLLELNPATVQKVDLSDEKMKYVEDLYFSKICSDTNTDLLNKIQSVLFPDGTAESQNDITCDTVQIMYLECAHSFSYKYNEGSHAWCRMFDVHHLEMFEEMHDLQYYYTNGYHNKSTITAGKPMLKDISEFLIDSKGTTFKYFSGNQVNCMSLVTGLKLFKDSEALTLDDIKTDRKWKTSLMFHYGCNIMVVVYDCGTPSQQQVSIYLNEVALHMVLKDNTQCTKCPIAEVKEFMDKLSAKQY